MPSHLAASLCVFLVPSTAIPTALGLGPKAQLLGRRFISQTLVAELVASLPCLFVRLSGRRLILVSCSLMHADFVTLFACTHGLCGSFYWLMSAGPGCHFLSLDYMVSSLSS
jgi:hypothetical protein